MSLADQLSTFFADYAAAWTAYDMEAVAVFVSLPLIIVAAGTTQFVEDATVFEDMLDAHADDRQARGVTHFAATVTEALPLPDDAARATVDWLLSGDGGAEVVRFTAHYTLARDDGRWWIRAIDTGDQAFANTTR